MGYRSLQRRHLFQLGVGLVACSLVTGCRIGAPTEPPKRASARIGLLTTTGLGATPENQAFLAGLQAAGWVMPDNLRIDYRFAQSPENVIATVDELVEMKPDVIVAESNGHVKALKAKTTDIPIVMALCSDPVKAGLVASLARPGGNVTGVATLSIELTGKRLDLLRQTLPHATRILCIWIPEINGDAVDPAEVQSVAQKVGLTSEVVGVNTGPEVRDAFERAARTGIDAVVMLTDTLSPNIEKLWADLVATTRLPVISGNGAFARAGTLFAYGPSLPRQFSRATTYVDRILRGVRPGDLPVEQPSEFDFVVNFKTAKVLNVQIPDAVAKQATVVVQ